MIKAIVGGLLACTLFACGGAQDKTELVDDSEAAPSQAVLIDQVDWNGEVLAFYDATTADDGAPAIIISQFGDNRIPELEAQLSNRAQYPITPAEIWREATGDDRVPEELMAQHVAMALDDGRPNTELQNFDLREKAGFPDVNFWFPLDANSTGTFTTPHCWSNGGIKQVATGPGTPSNSYSTCTSNATPVRNFSIDGQCDTAFNQNTTVRAGSYNGAAFPLTSKYCFATGSGVWSCAATQTLNFNFYYSASFYKNGSKHRMGSGFSVSTADTLNHASSYLATATLADTLPRFEDTGCTAFTENFRRP